MISQLALSSLEAVMNHYLSLDPNTPPRFKNLDKKVLAMVFKGTPVTLYVKIKKQQIRLSANEPHTVDTTLTASPLTYAKMGLTHGTSKLDVLSSGELEITGDVETGQKFQTILADMDIDWEEHLSYIVGDVVAHQLGQAIQKTTQWGGERLDAMQKNMTEYLQEELRQLPPREEVEDFFNDIDVLRMDLDRLQARLQRLQQQGTS